MIYVGNLLRLIGKAGAVLCFAAVFANILLLGFSILIFGSDAIIALDPLFALRLMIGGICFVVIFLFGELLRVTAND